jgi:CRISPR/Cas system-associated exonuclease Cas4 (RecB family)
LHGGERVIYEAAFLHDGVLAALDILVRDGEGWRAYEVKSSGSAKEYQVHDAALQAHVIEGCGLRLMDVSIVHLNTGYVRRGALEVEKLFAIKSVKGLVDREREAVPARIAELKRVVQQAEVPDVDIGPYCSAPFECDFKYHCWAHVSAEGSVFELSRGMG